jgi:WD40 repeat protein/serine/threonine protein kinase
MPSVAAFMESIRQNRLLQPEQLQQTEDLRAQHADLRSLAIELIRRGWLTAFQVNQLIKEKGHELLLGSYVILERVGEGGMGQVFKARNWKIGRTVALKIIHKERLANESTVRRFRREIRAAAQLQHPNVVQTLDADQVGEIHLMVMEYVEGGKDLNRLIKEEGPLPVPQACDYIRQAALGLQHAHERGLVHRDIKPHNLLLVRKKSLIKVLDMGLARFEADEDSRTSQLTREGAVMGTPDYIAPEQAVDSHAVDIRADLYSLGCVFFYLLSGQVPFPGGTVMEKLIKHQSVPAPLVNTVRPDAPEDVVRIISRLMAKNPEERLQTPGELASILDNISRGKGFPAEAIRPPGPAETLVNPFAQLGSDETQALENPLPPVVTPLPIGRKSATARPGKQRKTRWPLVAGGIAALLVLVAVVAMLRLKRAPDPTEAGGAARTRFTVESNQTWQDTGVDVDPETVVAVAVTGKWEKKGWSECSAGGIPENPRDRNVLFDAPPMCLLFRIGNHEPFTLPKSKSFRPRHPGRLFVQANELDLRETRGRLVLEFTGSAHEANQTDRPQPTHAQAAEAELKSLRGKRIHSPAELANLRKQLAEFHGKYTETPQAAQADVWFHAILADMPSPLDGLDRNRIPRDVRKWWQAQGREPPWELVGVLGKPRAAHTDVARAVAYSPDGKHVVSAGPDVRFWDPETFEPQWFFPEYAYSLSFTADGKTLVTAGPHVTVFDLGDGEPRTRTQLKESDQLIVAAIHPAGSKVAAVSNTGLLRVWELTGKEPKLVAQIQAHAKPGSCVAFSPDGKLLVTGGQDGKLRLWDVAGTMVTEKANLEGPTNLIYHAAFSHDGHWLASVGHEQMMHLWDLRGSQPGKATKVPTAHFGLSVAFAPSGKSIAAGLWNGDIAVWSLAEDGQPISPRSTKIHEQQIWGVAFAPDSKRLVTADSAAMIRQWNVTGPQPVEISTAVTGHHGRVNAVAFSTDGRFLFSGGQDKTARLWDVLDGKDKIVCTHEHEILSVALSPDDHTGLCGGMGPYVSACNLQTGGERRLEGQRDRIADLCFSTDGQRAFGAGYDGTILNWELKTGKERKRLEGHGAPVMRLARASFGQTIASGAMDNSIRIWRLSGRDPEPIVINRSPVYGLAYTRDGWTLVASSADSILRWWDVRAQEPVEQKSVPTSSPFSTLAMAPDGKVLAGAGNFGVVAFFDPISGRKVREWQMPAAVRHLAFAPDSRHVALAIGDGTIAVFRLTDLKPQPEAVETAYKKLLAQVKDPKFSRRQLWDEAARLRMTYPGTPQADRTRALMQTLPSPLDQLDAAAIDPGERYGWQPKELVAIVGSHRFRHAGGVTQGVFSPNGKMLASATESGEIVLWDAFTGRELRKLQGHSGLVRALAFHQNGKTLVSGSVDGTIRVWDTNKGEEVSVLGGHRDVLSLTFSPDGKWLASAGGEDHSIIIWQALSWKRQRVLEDAKAIVDCLAFHPDGRILAASGSDGTIRLWDVAEGKPMPPLTTKAGRVIRLAFHPTGELLAAAAHEASKLWDVKSGQERATFPPSWDVAFDSEGKVLAHSSRELKSILLWNVATGRDEGQLIGHTGDVRGLAFRNDGKVLASASADGTLGLWDVAGGKEIFAIQSFRGDPIVFTPDGRGLICSGGADSGPVLCDLMKPTSRPKFLSTAAHPATGLVISPSGRLLATGCYNGSTGVYFWDLSWPGKFVMSEGHTGGVIELAFSPDGQRIASTSTDHTVKLWDVSTGQLLHTLEGHGHEVNCAAFSPDGSRLVTGDANGQVKVWRADLGTVAFTLPDHPGQVRSLVFLRNADLLATLCMDGKVRFFEVKTAKQKSSFDAPPGFCWHLALSPDDKMLASSSDKGIVYLWDLPSGRKRREWRLPGRVVGTAFAPDSRHLALAAPDGTVYVLRLAREN